MPPSDDILLRDATDADGAAIASLIAGVFADYPNCPFVPAEFPELDAIATSFAHKRGRIRVAVAGDRLVGSFGIAPTHHPRTFELHKVYLDRRFRGRGIATRLLDEAIAFAVTGGADRLTLWTDTRFAEGHRFYAARGFIRQPGLRALHDAAATLEYNFAMSLAPLAR